jgi:hypothetical protein
MLDQSDLVQPRSATGVFAHVSEDALGALHRRERENGEFGAHQSRRLKVSGEPEAMNMGVSNPGPAAVVT